MDRAPSRLAGLLRRGQFVVTAELSAVDSADPGAVFRKVDPLRDHVDAVNCTDNTGAHVHLSSLAAARLLIDRGVEPIMQLATRDRNRLALQADLMGAAALGVRNVLLISGDDVSAGVDPPPRALFLTPPLRPNPASLGLRHPGSELFAP